MVNANLHHSYRYHPLPGVEGENRLKTSFGFLGDGLDDYLIQRPNERGGHLMFGGGRQFGPSIGETDDSALNEKTAEYLRGKLVDALGLDEGKSEAKTRPNVCRYCEVRIELCAALFAGVDAKKHVGASSTTSSTTILQPLRALKQYTTRHQTLTTR